MSDTSRAEIEEFWQRWLDANRRAEEAHDWQPLADFYAEDATYGWMYQPDEHFMAVGREQIREYALGTEMAGLDGWSYDYVATVIDEQQGMIIGFWKQRSGVADADGNEIEVIGIGGSWFGYGTDEQGKGQFVWQRDWFDLNSAGHAFLKIIETGQASPGLVERMGLDGASQPGHYPLAGLPSTVWPPTVEGASR